MFRTKQSAADDLLFRKYYGKDKVYDSAEGTLGYRRGVGKIEDGPSIPRAKNPSGKVGNLAHKKVAIPSALAATSVQPAQFDFGPKAELTGSQMTRVQKAKSKVMAYAAKMKTG